ncbi:oligo-1,6-glucosidase [Pontibacillus halophilus JSM 076056 = DSM 19796]|uniref:oligo-1,6-glucosidase n=1 Tax=Pontibacillus halophilus JSM 076056 = DSM 19796 TaxID=1385510 RepID=A0A0A5GIM8_9BACI|nr:alpha-glucosidase [Pontibacillus halophilus]KGX91063.1 oligo-1,6-glucosidase [Pontibacillus halophilus JSM 076056 = DSM 19796]
MTKQWWKESVVYQIYPRSFNDSNGDGIGDLQGIIEKLDYLAELGIDVIWLSPVYDSPNDDNGYDIRDYRSIMNEFGSMEDFDVLLAEAHNRNIRIVMDLVVNHTSDEHSWFVESKSSKDNPKRDYYIWKDGKDGQPPTNWESAFSGSTWEYNEATGDYYLHIFSKKQPDLNWENDEVRSEVYDMMKWWLDKGIDGFRMDVVNFISKHPDYPNGEVQPGKQYGDGSPYFMNGPRIHEYLNEMNRQVLSNYDVMTVGEMPGVTPDEGKLYTADERNELNMVFHFEHMGVDGGEMGKWSLNGWNLTDLKEILSKWQYELEEEGWNSLYWNNHDQPRVVSRFGDDGEYRKKSAKMLGTCLHMMKGTPYIYQGEELGMTNVAFESIDQYEDLESLNMYNERVNQYGDDPAEVLERIHHKGRDNARTPMQWSAEENGGFTTGQPWLDVNPNYRTINAEEALSDEDSVFHYYKRLIQLRKENETIVYGKFDLLLEDSESIFAYTRTNGDETLLVLCNFTKEPVTAELGEFASRSGDVLITNREEERTEETQLGTVELEPFEATTFVLK